MTRRALRPHPPALTPAQEQGRAQANERRRKTESAEQRSMLRGLLLLALLIAVFALFRSGGALFAGGGWRRW